MIWHAYTENPQCSPTTGLIACRDDEDGEFYLFNGIYIWDGDTWKHEDSDRPIPTGREYWWCLEDELLLALKREATSAATIADKDNPFLSPRRYRGGDPVYIGAVDTASRIDMVANFDRDQCQRALQVPGLQKTVQRAVNARLKKLRRQEESGK